MVDKKDAMKDVKWVDLRRKVSVFLMAVQLVDVAVVEKVDELVDLKVGEMDDDLVSLMVANLVV